MSCCKRILKTVALAMLALVVLLLGCQSQLIYHPSAYPAGYEQTLATARGMRIRFATQQGAQTAFYLPPREGAATSPKVIWLCFGGNASLALDWLHYLNSWDASFAFLLVDYPGYGDCEGRPTPESLRENAKAATQALARHLGVEEQLLRPRLAVLGHSLGCAAALMAAEDLDIRRGVLISPFTSMTEMGRIVLGWPLCYLNLHRFDNRRTLRRVASRSGARFVILHGQDDEVIPVHMGRELAALNTQSIIFDEVADAHHNDILRLAQSRISQAMNALATIPRDG